MIQQDFLNKKKKEAENEILLMCVRALAYSWKWRMLEADNALLKFHMNANWSGH